MLDVVLIFPMSLQSLVPPGNPAVGGLLIFVIIKMIFLDRFKGHEWSYSVFLKLPKIHYNPKYKQEWQALNYTLGETPQRWFCRLMVFRILGCSCETVDYEWNDNVQSTALNESI